MGPWLESARKIIQRPTVTCVDGEMELVELAPNSRCRPIQLAFDGECWAIKLSSTDYHPLFADLPATISIKKLPDYLVFCQGRTDDDVRVLVCELKSSDGGAQAGLRQVQMGVLLSRYLLRVAHLAIDQPHPMPDAKIAGIIVYPGAPMTVRQRPKTRVNAAAGYSASPCNLSGVLVYSLADKAPYRLEDLLYF